MVLAANTMDLLDATIVNVAGPSIHRDLGGGASTIQWLSAGYTLAFAVLLIAGARLGDIFGRRRLFLLGSAGFTLFSAACAVAPGVGWLIAFRALQGGFGALMIPQGFGLMKEVFDDEELGKATNLFGPMTGLAMLGAPILAGALIDANLWNIGWRLVFLINVPIGALTLPFAIRSLPSGSSHPGLKLDVTGVWLVGLAFVAIIYPLIQGQTLRLAGLDVRPARGWRRPAVRLHPLRTRGAAADALIEPSLLRNRTYLSGIAIVLSLFGAFGGLLLCVSLYGQLGEGWSPIHAGISLTPMVIGMIAGMGASTALAKQLGRRLLHVGVVLIAAGTVTLALLLTGAHASTWDLVPGLFLIGAGFGACLGQLFQFILTSVNMQEVGSASGVMEASQQLSTALGVAVLGTIFFSTFTHHPADRRAPDHRVALPVPLAAAFVLVFRLPRHAREQAG